MRKRDLTILGKPTTSAQKAADDARAALSSRGDVTPDLERAIARYAKAVALADRAWSEVPADTLLTTGSTGQLVAHPAIAIAQAADREAAKYAKELGIEGHSKRGPGRPVGAVSAPDRAAAPPKLKVLRDAG